MAQTSFGPVFIVTDDSPPPTNLPGAFKLGIIVVVGAGGSVAAAAVAIFLVTWCGVG